VWFWYSRNPFALALLPLAGLFGCVVALRRRLYRDGWLPHVRLPVPVLVVGNISVGGSGKTPLVIHLVQLLRNAGYRPGVVSRGYGGRGVHRPERVMPDSDADRVGDEPVLIAIRAGCPMVVDPDRPRAARELLQLGCDVVVSDDGLQHYRLERDLEIAVIDGRRGVGNGWLLPAGPLREPISRLSEVALVVGNGAAAPGQFLMRLQAGPAWNLRDSVRCQPLEHWRGRKVHAVAGIGDPQRFFAMLDTLGIEAIAHPFPDHHRFRVSDLAFDDELTVLMTEKDAIKCRDLATERHWAVPVDAELDSDFDACVLARLAASFRVS
jgi:tetraacyldisaccharide 4'-kinase